MSEQNYMSTRAVNATIDELREELTAAQQRAERAEQEATKIRQREVSLLMQWQEKVDAAQQRVAELEREAANYEATHQAMFAAMQSLSKDAAEAEQLKQQIVELQREAESMRGLLQASQVSSDRATRERCSMETENAELRRLTDRHDRDYAEAQKRVGRLRELLQTYKQRLDARWREGTRVDSYARGYQDGLEAAEVIFDDVFQAELAKGE